MTGKKIELIKMGNDPDPIPSGARGTIESVVEFGGDMHLNVTWDESVGRSLNLVVPPDEFIVL